MINKEIGNRILETRKEKGITRESLAETAEISTKFLYEIENGKKGISAETLYKISNGLNCSCDYLLTGALPLYPKRNELIQHISKFNSKQNKKILKIIKLIYEISVNK